MLNNYLTHLLSMGLFAPCISSTITMLVSPLEILELLTRPGALEVLLLVLVVELRMCQAILHDMLETADQTCIVVVCVLVQGTYIGYVCIVYVCIVYVCIVVVCVSIGYLYMVYMYSVCVYRSVYSKYIYYIYECMNIWCIVHNSSINTYILY